MSAPVATTEELLTYACTSAGVARATPGCAPMKLRAIETPIEAPTPPVATPMPIAADTAATTETIEFVPAASRSTFDGVRHLAALDERVRLRQHDVLREGAGAADGDADAAPKPAAIEAATETAWIVGRETCSVPAASFVIT